MCDVRFALALGMTAPWLVALVSACYIGFINGQSSGTSTSSSTSVSGSTAVSGSTLMSVEDGRTDYPDSSTYDLFQKYHYNNGTVWVNTTTYPNGLSAGATWVTTWEYPNFGPCAFRYYRVRLYPMGTDASNLAAVTEVILYYQNQILENAVATLQGPTTGGTETDPYSSPTLAVDGLRTAWVDLDLRDLILDFGYDVLADEACIALGRKPSMGISWALDGARTPTGPWYVRQNITDLAGDVGYLQCSALPADLILPWGCVNSAEEINPWTVPHDWYLVDDTPVMCIEPGACLHNGTCAPYNTGPLCHQCLQGGAMRNATRFRNGDACEMCPEYWRPVLMAGFFILFYLAMTWILIIMQYRQSVKPWRFLTALEIDDEWHSDEEAFSHSYALALIRLLLDHHCFVAWAWQDSGLVLSLPRKAKPLAMLMDMDWFRTMGVSCVISSWEVPDQLTAANIIIPFSTLLLFSIGYFFLSDDYFNDCEQSGCGVDFCIKSCRVCGALCEYLASCKCCPDPDEEGAAKPGETSKLSDDRKEEAIQAAMDKLRVFEKGPQKDREWLEGPPKAVTLSLAAITILNFIQLPLLSNAFLISLDCVTLPNYDLTYLRADLRLACDGSEYAGRVTASIIGILFWMIGMPFFVASWIYNYDKERGKKVQTQESPFMFLVSGIKPKRWWFSVWKMFLKELYCLLMLFVRMESGPTGIGMGNEAGLIAGFGLFCGVLHVYMQPYDLDKPYLQIMETVSWCAVMAAPITRLSIGVDGKAATYKGASYIGLHPHEADTGWQWCLILVSAGLYCAVPVLAAFCCLEDEYNWWVPPKLRVEIAERVHMWLPKKERQRKWFGEMLTMMFRESLNIDHAEAQIGNTVSPSAVLESILIISAKDAAKAAGREGFRDVEIGAKDFAATMDRISGGLEDDRLMAHRAVLEPGGLAEATMLYGDAEKERNQRLAAKRSKEEKKKRKELADNNQQALEEEEMSMIADNMQTDADNKVIMFSFAIECVELKSLGFRAGEGSSSNDMRKGVRQCLERGIAAASACTEADVSVNIHPVGLDRALVVANVYASKGADKTETDVQLRIREEWLRNTLGTREGRIRWGKAVEGDLQRVGVASAIGFRLQVRFTRGSRPQRMNESLAKAAGEATVAAASAAAVTDNRPEPSLLGRLGHGGFEDEEEEVWTKAAPQGRLKVVNESHNATIKARERANAREQVAGTPRNRRMREGSDDAFSDEASYDSARPVKTRTSSERRGRSAPDGRKDSRSVGTNNRNIGTSAREASRKRDNARKKMQDSVEQWHGETEASNSKAFSWGGV